MWAKLDKFNHMNEEQNAEDSDVEEQTGIPSTAFHLGAPEKGEKPLSDLMNTTRFSVPHLLQMLETYINRFRTAGEGYYRVQRGHMVIVFDLLWPVKANTDNTWQIKEFHYL